MNLHLHQLISIAFLICGSPIFYTNATPARSNLSFEVLDFTPVSDPIGLRWPTHIAFGPHNLQIITDLKNSRLVYRTSSNEPFQVSPLKLNQPHSVAYNPTDGLFYANDTDNNRIISFANPSSEQIAAQTNSIAGISLDRPHDIVVDPIEGWIYTINPNSGHVFRFTAIGENEESILVPVQGYARSLTFANNRIYVIGSAKGRVVEISDWSTAQFKIFDSFDQSGRNGPAGSWERTGLVLNDVEFFGEHWYATSYFTQEYAHGSNPNINKFVRFKTFEDFTKGDWTDLSDRIPNGLTPYYLTAMNDKLYLSIFNHESPGQGDSILQISPIKEKKRPNQAAHTMPSGVGSSRSSVPAIAPR